MFVDPGMYDPDYDKKPEPSSDERSEPSPDESPELSPWKSHRGSIILIFYCLWILRGVLVFCFKIDVPWYLIIIWFVIMLPFTGLG